MRKSDVRRMSEGAMMLAIIGIFLFFNRQSAQLLESVLGWLTAIPIIIYSFKYTIKDALVVVIAAIILSFVLGTLTTVIYVMSASLIGIIYAYCIMKRKSILSTVLLTTFLNFIFTCFTTIIFAEIFGYDIMEGSNIITQILSVNMPLSITEIMLIIAILFAIIYSVLQSLCIHLFVILMVRRLKLAITFRPFSFDKQVPRWVGYVCIVIFLLFLLVNMVKLYTYLYGILFFLCGLDFIFCIGYSALTVLSYAVLKRNKIYIIAWAIGIWIPLFNIMFVILGLADMLFHIRDKMKRGVIHGAF